MIGWIARLLLIVAGLITSLFVAEEALNFKLIQMDCCHNFICPAHYRSRMLAKIESLI